MDTTPNTIVSILVYIKLLLELFLLKSNVRLELIAQSRESPVEIIAQSIANAAIEVIKLLEVWVKKKIITLPPSGMWLNFIAAIPKINGIKENNSSKKPANNADVYAVFVFLALKKSLSHILLDENV